MIKAPSSMPVTFYSPREYKNINVRACVTLCSGKTKRICKGKTTFCLSTQEDILKITRNPARHFATK